MWDWMYINEEGVIYKLLLKWLKPSFTCLVVTQIFKNNAYSIADSLPKIIEWIWNDYNVRSSMYNAIAIAQCFFC